MTQFPPNSGQVILVRDEPLFPDSSIARLHGNEIRQTALETQPLLEIGSSSSILSIKAYAQGFRSTCSNWCSCVCHSRRTTKLSTPFRNILGSLFIGYTGFPNFTPACNEAKCTKRSCPKAEIIYYFPVWLLARVVSLTVLFSGARGPELNLKMPRMVGWTSPLWRSAQANELSTVQNLFSSGMASPFDVNAYGQSALHVSIILGVSLYHAADYL
jgi:hypothetical protein